MTSISPAKGVFETILDWSQARPAWQRDALRRIVQQGKLSESDIAELVTLCKQGSGAAKTIEPDFLAHHHIPTQSGASEPVSLVSITDVVGVNYLAPDQTLSFHPTGLTIIYGDNGAGKSGYSRILKQSCRARQRGTIEANIYQEGAAKPASATLRFRVGTTEQSPEKWKHGASGNSALDLVSVFDRDCATVHLANQNAIAFRPLGLDVPDELGEACKQVKRTLQAEFDALARSRHPLFTKPTWKETTQTGRALAGLKPTTNFAGVEAFSVLTPENHARLAQLKQDLTLDPAKAAAEQVAKADNLKQVVTSLTSMRGTSADAALNAITAAAIDARIKREAATLAAARAFSSESLPGVGGAIWKELWESARRFSADATGKIFPPALSDPCPLCLQPLGDDAVERVNRFENFIQLDTERVAVASEKLAASSLRSLKAASFNIEVCQAGLREIALRNPELAKQSRRYVAATRLRRYLAVKAAKGGETAILVALPADPIDAIFGLETSTRNYAAEIRKTADAEARKKVEQEVAELDDRVILAGILPEIKTEIERLKSVKFLEACSEDTTTNLITRFASEIADQVLTPKLRDRFLQEIVKLAADKVRVEIIRSKSDSGTPHYQIKLLASPRSKVAQILSEGEQTCVALAAFLTELATATNSSALVFDDPVTSLDHRWRKRVAMRLAEESKNRQIIVFTHDLIFVNDLLDLTKTDNCVTLGRSPKGVGAVTPGLPWKGKGVKHRIDGLEKDARAAKLLYEADDEDGYNNSVVTLYDKLRATWERAVEEVVFFGVVQRHRDYIDTSNIRKATVLNDADCDQLRAAYKTCSEIVKGHDPSRGRNAAPPVPDQLLRNIAELRAWVDSLRARQKVIPDSQ